MHNKLRIVVLAFLTLGTMTVAQAQPSFSKAFNPDTIQAGGTSTLTFTINNASGSEPVSDLAFTDNLPAGVVIANPADATNDCGGSDGRGGSISAPAGGGTITFSGGIVPAGGTCTGSVKVTSSTPDTHTNISGDLTSTAGNSGTASDLLTVEPVSPPPTDRPEFSKHFSPSTVRYGADSTLTFIIDNSANPDPAFNLAFSDTLPEGLFIADPPNAVTDCPVGNFSGSITAMPGDATITYASGLGFPTPAELAAGASCTVSVDVTAEAVGSLLNQSSDLTSQVGSEIRNSGPASATLDVVIDPNLALIKRFLDHPVPPGSTVQLRFSLGNLNRDTTATNITFTDDLDATLSGLTALPPLPTAPCGAGSSISGTSLLTLSDGSLESGGTCTFEVTLQAPAGAAAGTFPNTTSPVNADLERGNPIIAAAATDDLMVDVAPLLTKRFTNSPVGAGGTVMLEFTLANTSTSSSATEIAFRDAIDPILPTVSSIPAAGFCGPEAVAAFIPPQFQISGASLDPGASCTFEIVLDVAAGAAAGHYPNTTDPVTATVEGTTRTGKPASDTLEVVGAPRLSKQFIDDPVDPGDTVTLRFTLSHEGQDEPPVGDALDIAFTDDLSAALADLAAVGLPRNAVCGDGSSISGTATLSFSGGALAPGESCAFDVTLQVPAGAPAGFHTNTTNSVTATVAGVATTGNSATDDLLVSGLDLTKEFLADPVLPGSPVVLRFTVVNDNPNVDATDIIFQDNLGAALPGLTATDLPLNDVCGAGSSISGTTTLSFSGGSLLAGESCTFDVTLSVPAGAVSATYANVTSGFSAMMGGAPVSFDNATDTLVVDANLLQLSKTFSDDPATPGGATTLEFTVTNLSTTETVSDITFTDDLDATLSGLVSESSSQSDVCGAGSQLNGTSVLTLIGGTLAPSTSCTFDATLRVPSNAQGGRFTNTTSVPTGSVGGVGVTGNLATDDLLVDRLRLSKVFDAPTGAGGEAMLTFTIENMDTVNAVDNLAFTDDLDAMISGLVATNTPLNAVCGSASQLAGTSLLTFSGGSLGPGESCSFDVSLGIPSTAPVGDFSNSTSELTSNGLSVGTPASDTLTIEPNPAFNKSFTPTPAAVGAPVELRFTVDNTAATVAASDLTFTDTLPAGLTVAASPNASTTCTGGTLTASAGSGTIGYRGGSVAAGASCTLRVTVVAPTSGTYVNVSEDLTSSLGNSGPTTGVLQSAAPFTIVESSGETVTTEAGGTDTFTVVLNFQPAGDVRLDATSSDTSEVVVTPDALTFSPADWNTPRTVTVTGVDDSLEDGDQDVLVTLAVDVAVSDAAFKGSSATVGVTNLDDDDDGIAPDVEDNAPNGGDGNGDGIPDSQQADVTSLPNATTGTYLTVVISGEGCTLVDVVSLDAETLPPDEGSDTAALPFEYPQGLIRFAAPCPQAAVSILFHRSPTTQMVRKYGPTIADDPNSVQWYDFSEHVSFSERVIGGRTITSLDYILSDGQLGDDDTDPERALNWVVDSIGLAQNPFSPPPAAIPTLNGWGVGLLMILMGLLGWRRMRCTA